MRTTLDLDDDLLRCAKENAVRTQRTLTAVVEDALREALHRRSQPVRKNPVKLLVSNQAPGLCPGVDLENSAALLDLMESEGDLTRR